MKNRTLDLASLKIHLNTRANGKTTLLQEGVKNYDKPFLFVCNDIRRGEFETGKNPHAIYVTENSQDKMIGSSYPIIVDHDTVSSLIDRIFELQTKNASLEQTLRTIKNLTRV
jgi:hypothetical protein